MACFDLTPEQMAEMKKIKPPQFGGGILMLKEFLEEMPEGLPTRNKYVFNMPYNQVEAAIIADLETLPKKKRK
jgi:hypothetical protein